MMRTLGAGLAGLVLVFFAAASAWAQQDYSESEYLLGRVASGDLPALTDRLPSEPLVVDLAARSQSPGRHGGQIVMLMRKARDTRQMYVYGYARLVKYNEKLDLVPDILKDYEVSDGGRTYTFHLREGHKWSDGHPFTTADFVYFWEDMAYNEDLYPSGPPSYMKVTDNYAEVKVIDNYTIRYSWPDPNPDFLPQLAQARPIRIYAPRHYLSRYHPNYRPLEELEQAAADAGQHNWAAIHIKKSRYYRMENPKLPTLQPWIPMTKAPADRFVFVRNPYFHKVDTNGLQLPYVDEVIFNMTEEKLIAGKAATGDVDLQGRYLRFDDVTLLKRNEAEHGYSTYLWRIAKGSHVALMPNLTFKESPFRDLVRDVRFRRALSLAIDRYEINRVIYFGLALEGQNTMLPQSPLYSGAYRAMWTQFDLDRANALLDEMGLERRWDGVRMMPNGKPLEIIVETSGSTEHADILELIADSWWRTGIKLFTKPLSKDSLRRRILSGQTQMTISSGFENGLATPDMSPNDLAPVAQVQYQWSEWGEYYETNGNGGAPPDMDSGNQLMELRTVWYQAGDRDTRETIWHEMLRLHADQLPTIGLIAGVLQPVVVTEGLKNLPEDGLWNWDPGAHFGLYGLDHVYWDESAVIASVSQ